MRSRLRIGSSRRDGQHNKQDKGVTIRSPSRTGDSWFCVESASDCLRSNFRMKLIPWIYTERKNPFDREELLEEDCLHHKNLTN
jgi:hypothetical protein